MRLMKPELRLDKCPIGFFVNRIVHLLQVYVIDLFYYRFLLLPIFLFHFFQVLDLWFEEGDFVFQGLIELVHVFQ